MHFVKQKHVVLALKLLKKTFQGKKLMLLQLAMIYIYIYICNRIYICISSIYIHTLEYIHIYTYIYSSTYTFYMENPTQIHNESYVRRIILAHILSEKLEGTLLFIDGGMSE